MWSEYSGESGISYFWHGAFVHREPNVVHHDCEPLARIDVGTWVRYVERTRSRSGYGIREVAFGGPRARYVRAIVDMPFFDANGYQGRDVIATVWIPLAKDDTIATDAREARITLSRPRINRADRDYWEESAIDHVHGSIGALVYAIERYGEV